MEDADRDGETAVHRRGQAVAGRAHEGASGLQVPAQAQDQDADEERKIPAARQRWWSALASRCRWTAVRRQLGGRPERGVASFGRRPAADGQQQPGAVPPDERVHAQRRFRHAPRPEPVLAAAVVRVAHGRRVPGRRRVPVRNAADEQQRGRGRFDALFERQLQLVLGHEPVPTRPAVHVTQSGQHQVRAHHSTGATVRRRWRRTLAQSQAVPATVTPAATTAAAATRRWRSVTYVHAARVQAVCGRPGTPATARRPRSSVLVA